MIWVIDAATTLDKVDVLSTAVLNTVTTSLLPKPLNTASFYLVVDGLVDNLDTHIEDSNSVIAEPLNIL